MKNFSLYIDVAKVIENVSVGIMSYESLPKRVKKLRNENLEDDDDIQVDSRD